MSTLTDKYLSLRQTSVRATLMRIGNPTDTPQAAPKPVLARLRRVLLRKLWLPRFLYEALPYLYISCGLVSLLAAAFAPEWTWILPYAILLGLICLHAGLAIATMRFRFRARRRKDGGD